MPTALLTAAAMVAFAANSVLCRWALDGDHIDAASFTMIRTVSGALTLALIVLAREGAGMKLQRDMTSATALFVYMAFFSFAYLSLNAGVGALILFGTVQITMFAAALRGGESFPVISWAGFGLAVFGLVYLVSPGLSAPNPFGAVLMAVAGIAWGIYSLRGRGAEDPVATTAANFVFAVPLALIVSLAFIFQASGTLDGVILAVLSGAVTSGLGYVIWYAALCGLSAGKAATVQLSVPIIAALGGVLLLSEDLSARMILASTATLGGIAIVMMQSRQTPAKEGR